MSKAPSQVGTNTTTTQTYVPPYVQAAQEQLMGAAAGMTAPFLNPPPNLVAPLTGDYITGLQTAQAMRNQEAGTGPTSVGGFGSYTMTPEQLNYNDIQQFFNPFKQDVVNTTAQQLTEANDKQLAAIRARQAAEGAYGGNRAALETSEQNRNFGNTLANALAGINLSGWQNAAQLGAGNAQMRQQGGIFNAEQALKAAQLQEQFNQAKFNRMLAANQQLLGVSDLERQQAQRTLDAPFYALQQLRSTVPAISTSGTSSSQPIYGPSTAQSIMPLAAAGIGALGMFSDRRAKKDIEKLGKDKKSGLDMYAYRYKGDPKNTPKVVGPMAQDMEKMHPGSTMRVGGKMVIKGDAARKILGL